MRLYVGGLEYPASAIQCRRRLGASTWLDVEIPIYSDADDSVLRASIGSMIEIRSDGASFLSAVLTDVDATWASMSASMRLTGRVQTPSYTQAHRDLASVFERATDNGRRSCRCAVDPMLRPNDTVDDGETTWTAGIILYRIAPQSAWMTVTEAIDG